MTEFNLMKQFFMELLLDVIVPFLQSMPIFYFVALIIGIYVCGLFYKLMHIGGKW